MLVRDMLVEELKTWYKLLTGERQREYIAMMIADARTVAVSSIHDVFTEDEIRRIKRLRPQKNECYKNAFRLAQLFPEKVEYVEGKMTVNKFVGIEHAWNKVGDKYVDVTMELALGRDASEEEYMQLGAWEYEDVAKIVLERGYYGECYAQEKFFSKKS